MSLVVIANFKIKPGREADADQALAELAAATHGESGCETYALLRDQADPLGRSIVEVWTSAEELERHNQAPHMATLVGRIDDLFDGYPQVLKYDSFPAGDAGKGAL
jgi:quinol monooxygenase YgiN